ncbi:MAG TPA: hypothetical protein V6D21_22070, partial [Candidatus Obscuribacterales bacterium]
ESTGEKVDISTTDSLWIIAYGMNGAMGVIGIFGTSLLPALTFSLLRYPTKTWFRPQVAGAASLSVVTVLYVLDNLLNDQYNPVFTLASGGLAGLVMNPNPQEFNSSVSVSPKMIDRNLTLNPPLPSPALLIPTKTLHPIPKSNRKKPRPIPISKKPNSGIAKLNRKKPRPIPISEKYSYGIPKLNRKKRRSPSIK